MMVDERETTNGHGFDLNCSLEPESNDEGGLLVDGSSSGVCFGEGTSAEGVITYKRGKRRKMCSSDEKTKGEFRDKIKTSDGSASNQDIPRPSFDAFPTGPSECSPNSCRKTVLQQMYQSLSGREDGLGGLIQKALATLSESGCTSEVKESLNSVERSDNRTHNSAKELSYAVCNGLSNQSESATISESCGRGFFDILVSDKFAELCGLLLNNFGVDNINRIFDVNTINMMMKSGAYETSPILYLKDIQQVWAKIRQVGNEMVVLANRLSAESRAHYEQFLRKPQTTDALGASKCHGCGEKAYVGNCLVCDSCEEMYHVSCSELVGPEIPPKSWYCDSCLSNGIGSPHHNCIICEKLKTSSAKSKSIPDGPPPNGPNPNAPKPTEEETHRFEFFEMCYICKSDVKPDDHFRTCAHSACPHKYYHYRCLTSKQLGVCGLYWYCPSCICQRCVVDKDDDKIVLCDGCDLAYHIYCTSPQLGSVPKGRWFCGKCDRGIKRIRTMRMLYENIQMKVKLESRLEKTADRGVTNSRDESKSGGLGLDMLVTAAGLNHDCLMDSR